MARSCSHVITLGVFPPELPSTWLFMELAVAVAAALFYLRAKCPLSRWVAARQSFCTNYFGDEYSLEALTSGALRSLSFLLRACALRWHGVFTLACLMPS
jgi:hypothetical protein